MKSQRVPYVKLACGNVKRIGEMTRLLRKQKGVLYLHTSVSPLMGLELRSAAIVMIKDIYDLKRD